MRILLVGNGGREHALAWRLARDTDRHFVVCPNGNPGIAQVADTPEIPLKSNADWGRFAVELRADLALIGPEQFLEDGLADEFRRLGIPTFGPGREGARLESSKAFSKEIMLAAGIPTAGYAEIADADLALKHVRGHELPVVIKADGLAAGKGVTVAFDLPTAEQAVVENLRGARFGAASRRIIIEDYLDGEEASVLAFCDGKSLFVLPVAQDHKRLLDGDQGPNTGGMGAYAPAPQISSEIPRITEETILHPLVGELRHRGIDFRGIIYAGLMLTKSGPKVVEFNARFGDPETQVLMPLLGGNFAEALLACAEGRSPAGLSVNDLFATTVVVASEGYPVASKSGAVIRGLDRCTDIENGTVFHAGTRRGASGEIVTAGGRVLSCTAWDTSLAQSRDVAYKILERISFEGSHFRRDIGWRALPPAEK